MGIEGLTISNKVIKIVDELLFIVEGKKEVRLIRLEATDTLRFCNFSGVINSGD